MNSASTLKAGILEKCGSNTSLQNWIWQMMELAQPSNVVWIDGTEQQLDSLREEAYSSGELIRLNQQKLPGCSYHRTLPNDVARVENRTYICTSGSAEDVGPTNNWMQTAQAVQMLTEITRGSMTGRTMYVIPFSMGPVGSKFSKIGFEITDSIYVVLNMAIMTRVGDKVMRTLGTSSDFVRGMHAKCNIDENKRYIMQFPEENMIWSVNSAYGGNVLLGKKCFALRIASNQGRKEGWLAEHMLIVGIQNPQGETKYIAAAFPSACGKTNLAMLIPPETYTKKGYKVWTVGDDIAWIRQGQDGRLWAVNPEAGFFGVAPGTNEKSNPNALASTSKNTIFTNVALAPDGTVWWEGLTKTPPEGLTDWKGNPWNPRSGEKAAHPNSRFTAPASNCPSISPEWENPDGVPLSAIIFGGRRAKTAPLVYQARDWNNGVFIGATMASETTAAAAGQVGVVRRDPMAMLPFCGYNMGDYWQHWIDIGKQVANKPQIFHVNWFRTDNDGNYMWPGYGENFRVIEWILNRCENKVGAKETAIGYVPNTQDINLEGMDYEITEGHKFGQQELASVLQVDTQLWQQETQNIREFFSKFSRLPQELSNQLSQLESNLQQAQ